jgi:hypothetical protein
MVDATHIAHAGLAEGDDDTVKVVHRREVWVRKSVEVAPASGGIVLPK